MFRQADVEVFVHNWPWVLLVIGIVLIAAIVFGRWSAARSDDNE